MFRAGKLGMGLVSSKQCRLPSGKICGELGKSPKSVPDHLTSTRYEVAHGNVCHVHERPSRELPLDRGIEHDQFQLS